MRIEAFSATLHIGINNQSSVLSYSLGTYRIREVRGIHRGPFCDMLLSIINTMHSGDFYDLARLYSKNVFSFLITFCCKLDRKMSELFITGIVFLYVHSKTKKKVFKVYIRA